MIPDAPTPGTTSGPSPVPSGPSPAASGPVIPKRRGRRPRRATTLDQRQLVMLFSGLTLLGLVLGSSAGAVVNAREEPAILVGALAGPSPTPTASPTPTPTPSATVTPTATATDDDLVDDPDDRDAPADETTPAAGTPDYRAISVNAATEPGLDFGLLTKVTGTDGTVTLVFDRATFYTGLEAAQHNQGKLPSKGYLIENTNPATRSFPLDPKASIVAVNRLLTVPGQVGQETLNGSQFLDHATRTLPSAPLPVWLRHTDGLTGPVTALAEQYLP